MDEPHVYLNGRMLPRSQATLDIEDRGFLFGDGVYEVLRYYGGKPLAMAEHVARFHRSLKAIDIDVTPEVLRLADVSDELVRRNGLRDAKVYWQVTRGAAPRNHDFPAGVNPTVMAITYPEPTLGPDTPLREIAAITAPDERWFHPWIKSVMLLPNVLTKHRAKLAGATEAILHRNGVVTEGTSTAVIVVRQGELWTHPADQWILPSVTRRIILGLARQGGIAVHETPVTLDELRTAEEIAILGTTTHVAAVTRLDGKPVDAGSAGPVIRRLYDAFVRHVLDTCR